MAERQPPAAPRARRLQRELFGWSVLAIAALAIAGVFAFLLALSRVPGIETVLPWPVGFFHKGLVIHVVFSFVVWFLAVFGALTLLAVGAMRGERARLTILGTLGVWGTAIALPLLFLPALLDRGEATLNNYVPTIIDPYYYLGLGVLLLTATASALRLLVNINLTNLLRAPVAAATVIGALIALIAVACFLIAWGRLAGTPPSYRFNEDLMWGGGHVLQFLNTLMMVIAWNLLAAVSIGRGAVAGGGLLAAAGILLGGALPAPLFYYLYPPFSGAQTQAFTMLQYLLGPAALVAALPLVRRWPRPLPWAEPGFLALALSLMLFAVGGLLGLFVDGADTRTPAHYHGVIAAVTVAFMGLFFTTLLPILERGAVAARWQRLVLHLFAWGQLVACLGLFIAGGHGAPRKVAGAAQDLTDLVPMIGMAMNGLGGLVAVAGGVLFIITVAVALLRTASSKNSPVPAT